MSVFILKQIDAPALSHVAAHAKTGMAFEPALLVSLYSPDQWERFTEEWLQAFKNDFAMIRRLSGPGDRGLDVLAFTTATAISRSSRHRLSMAHIHCPTSMSSSPPRTSA